MLKFRGAAFGDAGGKEHARWKSRSADLKVGHYNGVTVAGRMPALHGYSGAIGASDGLAKFEQSLNVAIDAQSLRSTNLV
jgi:hypothetical protein